VNQYVLTRSSFSAEVDLAENKRRLEMLRAITVPSMRAQDIEHPLRWIVLIDPSDPLLNERIDALHESRARIIVKSSEGMVVRGGPDRPWGPWKKHIDWRDSVLTTRLDDDDAIAPWFTREVRAVAETLSARAVLVFPEGWRVMGDQAEHVRYNVPMFSSLFAPRGDHATINDVGHLSAAKLARITLIEKGPAWVWVRHDMSRSHQNMRRSISLAGEDMRTLPSELTSAFPVDWEFVSKLPQKGPPEPDMKQPMDLDAVFDPRSAEVHS